MSTQSRLPDYEFIDNMSTKDRFKVFIYPIILGTLIVIIFLISTLIIHGPEVVQNSLRYPLVQGWLTIMGVLAGTSTFLMIIGYYENIPVRIISEQILLRQFQWRYLKFRDINCFF